MSESEDFLTADLINSIRKLARVLTSRNLESAVVEEALMGMYTDNYLKGLLDIGKARLKMHEFLDSVNKMDEILKSGV